MLLSSQPPDSMVCMSGSAAVRSRFELDLFPVSLQSMDIQDECTREMKAQADECSPQCFHHFNSVSLKVFPVKKVTTSLSPA